MTSDSSIDADLLVIGWGKAGKTLARAHATAGERVVIVEADPQMVGGTCINIGCVPTKALVHRAAGRRDEDAAGWFRSAQGFRTALTAKLRAANLAMVDDLDSSTVLIGTARFVGDRTVEVATADGTVTVRGTHVVVNTGSEPSFPPIEGLRASAYVVDSTGVQLLGSLPERLVVLGAGPIGLELADAFTRFGSQVTVVDVAERLLPREDEDVAASVRAAMEDAGTTFLLGASARRVVDGDKAADLILDVAGPDGGAATERTLTAEAILVVTGRNPRTAELDLEAGGIAVGERGAITVDEHLRTSAEGVFAVGDVNGGPQFTYISYDDHRIVADQLRGGSSRSTEDRVAVPTTTFLTPPLARVGLTEAEATERGIDVVVRSKPVAAIAAMPRPKAVEETHGLIKVLVEAGTDRIVGAALHTVDAQEVVNLLALAMRHGITASDLRDGIWTHPSSTEALNEVLA
ncbi:FAD-dependent oxidoreductase [Georgenia sp. Z1491]|uniref:FAD-dependent oxidoreductase n=1 Tax=Georgenia sp. Z1491 TaxID=3416707 RepID=UPI003CF5D246